MHSNYDKYSQIVWFPCLGQIDVLDRQVCCANLINLISGVAWRWCALWQHIRPSWWLRSNVMDVDMLGLLGLRY